MGGVIGATSGKFLLAGVTLLLPGRIDDVPARIAIVPGAPVSAITADLVDRLRVGGGTADVTIHLRAESFRASIMAVYPQPAAGADLRIGQDVLAATPIVIDFAHRRLQPLSVAQAQRFEDRARPIVIRRDADGTRSVDLVIDGHAPVRAQLDLSVPATTAPGGGGAVRVGGVVLPGVGVTPGPRPVVGLYAFAQVRVLFDLVHDRIWVGS